MTTPLEQLEFDARAALDAAASPETLEQFRIDFLGPKGRVRLAMKEWLPKASGEEKKTLGQGLNNIKAILEESYNQKMAAGSGPAKPSVPLPDITEPGLPPQMGRSHVLAKVLDELLEVFARMGFEAVEGPEIEDDRHNFIALNIPPQHPARDPRDNFYLDRDHLLRTQTSTIQIRIMEERQPPLRIIAPGRVYRPDTHDATHSSMFHQIEGLYVDRKVSMVDLKTTLMQFANAFFGPAAEVRLRPSYFPFTEPSAELDIRMEVAGRMEWVELGGCGMVDPAVFEAVGYDPAAWTGFAFGLGVERIAMRRFGVQDIRHFYENDLRFLRQF